MKKYLKPIISLMMIMSLMLFTACIDEGTSNDEHSDSSISQSDISANAKTIKVPMTAKEVKGLHYSKVVRAFEDAGFTNVTISPYLGEYDYNNDDYFDGIVLSILIDDKDTFNKNSKFNSDADVFIVYVTEFEDNNKENNINDNNSIIVPEKEETQGTLVWVPVNGGTKYHSRAGCSNMDNPMQVSKETAISNGYTSCGRCW